MADVMTFPATFDEFAEQYKIVDKKRIYTNGTELIPIFRVQQWLEHADVIPKSFFINQAKRDVARKIFEEIKRVIEVKIITIEEELAHNTASNEDVSQKKAFEEILDDLAKLKKKYIGESKC